MKKAKPSLPPHSRRTNPFIPADDSQFVWSTGADVQATWRKYGWVPPTEITEAKRAAE